MNRDGSHSISEQSRLVAVDPGKKRLLTYVVQDQSAERCFLNTTKSSPVDRFVGGHMPAKEWSFLCGHKCRCNQTNKKLQQQPQLLELNSSVSSAAVLASVLLLHRCKQVSNAVDCLNDFYVNMRWHWRLRFRTYA